jgi:hypothetical protein
MIRSPVKLVVLTAVCFSALPTAAGETEHWGEYAIQKNINDRVSLKSDIQLRVRDNISDFYWSRWEIGPNIRIDKRRLNLITYFRVKRQEYSDGWANQYNIFIDPIFKLYNDRTTTLDFRVRLHTQLNGDYKRQFIRLRPRLTTRFMLGKTRCSWFTYNDFWMQVSDLGARDRYNVNWLGSGVRFGLNYPLSLAVYVQYRSDKLPATGEWDHDPVLGSSLQCSF